MKKLFFLVALTLVSTLAAQTPDSLSRARQFLSQLRQEQFQDIARDFDAEMSAALPPAALRQTWAALRAQLGAFQSEIDAETASIRGMNVVTIGCQFERAALNMVVSFDADKKIAGLQFVPRRAAAAAPPVATLPAGLTEEAVTVGSGEFALPGTLTLPNGAGRAPAVVLVHGSGPQDRDETIGANKPFRDLAWGLAARGIAVVRYEKRTRQHGGKMAQNPNLTVREETVDDAVLAAQLLRKHPRVDAARVFVLGHSLGGMVAPLIGREDPALAGLVVMAGNTRSLPELVLEQTEYLVSISPNPASQQAALVQMKRQMALAADPDLPLDTPPAEIMGVPAAYWRNLNAYRPGAVAATLAMPLLFLQGERDYQVTMQDFEGWRESLKGHANATFKSYPDLNHLFVTGVGKATPSEYEKPGKVVDAVMEDIAAWIRGR